MVKLTDPKWIFYCHVSLQFNHQSHLEFYHLYVLIFLQATFFCAIIIPYKIEMNFFPVMRSKVVLFFHFVGILFDEKKDDI